MGTHRLKHSFSAGELSPLMEARTDFKRFNNGCNKLRNMKCTTQGPVTRRSGTEFIANLGGITLPGQSGFEQLDHTQPIRTIPFIFNEIQSYVLIFFRGTSGATYMLIGWNNDLLRASDATPLSSEDRVGGATVFDFAYPGLAGVSREYYIVADNTEVETYIDPGDYDETTSDPSQIQMTIINDVYAQDGVISVYDQIKTSDLPILVDLERPDFDIEHFDYAQSADEMYIASYNYEPFIIARYSHTDWRTTLTGITFSTNGGADGLPHWDATFGWPETVTFHQQRLAFGGTQFYRQTVWMSASNSLDDFLITSTTSPLPADTAIQFRLDADTQNKIRWMISGKALLIGTLGNEWTVTGATFSALTPTNLLSQRQTNLGSERTKPIMVGITTLFVERFGRTINEFVYDFNTDSYKTSDMSILSKHVTDHSPIKYWDYQQTPDSIIWSVREDGILLGTTYQRQHEVIGWHVHNTDGLFKTVTCIPGSDRADQVWVVVEREIGGAPQIYLELFASEFLGDEASDGHFLDSHVHGEATTTQVNYANFPYTGINDTGGNLTETGMPDMFLGDILFVELEVAALEWANPSANPLEFSLSVIGNPVLTPGNTVAIAYALVEDGPGSVKLEVTLLEDFINIYVRIRPVSQDAGPDNSVSPHAKVTLASVLLDGVEIVTNPNFIDDTGWTVAGTATIVHVPAITTMEGLDHLENHEVGIVVEGVVYPVQTVVGGIVYLPEATAGQSVLVGLNYTSEVWPTIKDIDQRDGTSAGRVQRITNLDFDIYNTGSFWSGRWSRVEGEKEEYINLETDKDDPLVQIPLYTGIEHYEFPEGYDRDSTYFIKQKQPLPLTLRAVVDTIEVYK